MYIGFPQKLNYIFLPTNFGRPLVTIKILVVKPKFRYLSGDWSRVYNMDYVGHITLNVISNLFRLLFILNWSLIKFFHNNI